MSSSLREIDAMFFSTLVETNNVILKLNPIESVKYDFALFGKGVFKGL